MSDEIYTPADKDEEPLAGSDSGSEEDAATLPVARTEATNVPDRRTLLAGMFRNWFLEYSSYVILERAVPNIADGLKPVQRRILHAMRAIDDGRMNKVANIVGQTMQYHPHGDASIGDALVQLGQKGLLIETQGNWGNILTGDSAAAPRYIEARLSEFAMEAAFSPKITEWTPSYDGRNQEPVTLPMKFPLLLAQGVEGIAVGLSSKILPHNFNELCDAAIAYLRGEEFTLLPDFPTGGLLDASRYNAGARGGAVRVRAKIEKIDSKTLAITEVPFGKTTTSLISSILSAVEKGKIKVRKVDDNTSAEAMILVHLAPGVSSDKAIDALYAFTDCEVSISPNCCVICERKPCFLSVDDVLRDSADRTCDVFRRELEIKLLETREAALFASLEKIFIQNRIYKDAEIEQAVDMEAALRHLERRLAPFASQFFRPLEEADLMKLWEIRMGRILKFNAEKADELLARLEAQEAQIQYDLEHITEYTINWYTHLKEKYGSTFPRRTLVRNFDSIEATKVADANKRLCFDKKGGFIGTGLKDAEFQFACSDLDDVIVFYDSGKYKVVRVQDKLYVGQGVRHIGRFRKSDERTIYNVIYLNGAGGYTYKKRFRIDSLTRDKEYDLTKGLPGSRIEWFSANPNGEAEVVEITLSGNPDKNGRKPRTLKFTLDFADVEIKGRSALGNLVTKYELDNNKSKKHKGVKLVSAGRSTLGGREVWFDADVLRLNYDKRGRSLGLFHDEDKVLVITKDYRYYTTNFSDSNHYEDNVMIMEKFDPRKVWTLVLFDAALGYPYLKRFTLEPTANAISLLGGDAESRAILLTDTPFARLQVSFAGEDAEREPIEIETADFIGVKSVKAKGKRLTKYELGEVAELEPTRLPEVAEEEANADEEPEDADSEELAAAHVPGHEASAPGGASEVVQGELFDLDSLS